MRRALKRSRARAHRERTLSASMRRKSLLTLSDRAGVTAAAQRLGLALQDLLGLALHRVGVAQADDEQVSRFLRCHRISPWAVGWIGCFAGRWRGKILKRNARSGAVVPGLRGSSFRSALPVHLRLLTAGHERNRASHVFSETGDGVDKQRWSRSC